MRTFRLLRDWLIARGLAVPHSDQVSSDEPIVPGISGGYDRALIYAQRDDCIWSEEPGQAVGRRVGEYLPITALADDLDAGNGNHKLAAP